MTFVSNINKCISKGIFPGDLKNDDVTPKFKKDGRMDKTNYRPISILPTLSKHSLSSNKYINTLTIFFLNSYVGLGRVIAHNILCYSCWSP